MTIGVKGRALWAAVEVSYEKAPEFLKKWHDSIITAVFGVEGSTLVEELKGLALRGEAKRIVERLWQEALRQKGDMKTEIKDLIRYGNNNYDWIENISFVGGYGSGPIERTVDITVARRFKKRGMSWYKSGANPLLRLRLLKLNGQWDTYW